jgi:hypothetical protein
MKQINLIFPKIRGTSSYAEERGSKTPDFVNASPKLRI